MFEKYDAAKAEAAQADGALSVTARATELLSRAMHATFLVHLEAGEFVSALELIAAGREINADNLVEAQRWLTDYARPVE